MEDGFDMDALRAELQRAMDARGIKAKPLSIAAKLNETAVRDIMEDRVKDVRLGTLRKLAGVLGIPVERLVGHAGVPLTGRIGAGGCIAFDYLGTEELVPRPPHVTGDLEALEVVGDSMLPRFSQGDVVYIRRTHDGILPEYFGEYCAVHLATGETYLKMLAKGTRPNRYSLRSLNAADIEDVEVVWATPVLFVLPRIGRLKLATI